ncbi:MAG: PAS domain S-box protein [Myxococcales bacterium]|nr:MAG: PAS domain S-box protein [Myxococcales bacterium]
MTRSLGSSPRASLSSLPAPREQASPVSSRDGSPISGDVPRAATSTALLEQQRDELSAENMALRARLELLSSLERAAWWDWDVKTERITAHGDLVELVQLDLPPDLGVPGLGRWLALLHPEDVRRARAAFVRSVSEPGEIAACPLRVRARGGGYRWVLVALTASADVLRGHSLRVFGAARDIHIERMSEEFARRNAQVLGAMVAGVVCADMDGVIGYVNGAAARLLGSGRDCVGRSLFELFPEQHREDLLELATIASNGGAPRFHVEQEVGGAPPQSLWLELSSYGDASGKPAGLVCVLGDATDRRGTLPSS